MRKLFVALVVNLLLAVCDIPKNTWKKPAVNRTIPDEPVVFKDANLEAVVRTTLKKPQGNVTRKEIAPLKTLNTNNAGISDLTGLQFATNLTDIAPSQD